MQSNGDRTSDTMMKRSLLDHGKTSSIIQCRVQEHRFTVNFTSLGNSRHAIDKNDVLLIISEFLYRIFISKVITLGIFQIANINFIMITI